MHENVLQKWLYVKAKNFGIEVGSQRGFEKGNMSIILTMNPSLLCCPLQHLNLI